MGVKGTLPRRCLLQLPVTELRSLPTPSLLCLLSRLGCGQSLVTFFRSPERLWMEVAVREWHPLVPVPEAGN